MAFEIVEMAEENVCATGEEERRGGGIENEIRIEMQCKA